MVTEVRESEVRDGYGRCKLNVFDNGEQNRTEKICNGDNIQNNNWRIKCEDYK